MWDRRAFALSVTLIMAGAIADHAQAQGCDDRYPWTCRGYGGAPEHTRGGGRFALGWWCPHFCNNLGIEVDYFFLGRREDLLRRVNGEWRIARRKVYLDHAVLPRAVSVFF